MGLIMRIKTGQRIYVGDIYFEVEKVKGQYRLYIDGPNPFPVKVQVEKNEDFYKRVGGDTRSGKTK